MSDQPNRGASDSEVAGRHRPGPPDTFRDPQAWLWAVAGLGFIGFGGWVLMRQGWTHTWGLLCVAMGLCMMPWLPLGVVGGVGLLAFAVWLGTHALGPYDYLLTLIAVVIGGGRLLEAYQAIRAKGARRGDDGGPGPRDS